MSENIPECRARSRRNRGRLQIGMVGEIISERWATSARNQHLVSRLGLCRARAPVERLDPHAPHQRLNVTPASLAPIGSQKTAQHPRPREGKLQMQPVNLATEIEIGRLGTA